MLSIYKTLPSKPLKISQLLFAMKNGNNKKRILLSDDFDGSLL